MHERAERVRRASVTWALSLVVHGALIGAVTLAAFANLRHQKEDAERARLHRMLEPIPIDLPLASDGTTLSPAIVNRVGDVPVVTGGATVQRIDDGRYGRGGDATSPRATHLSDRDERLHFTTDTVSHYDRDQLQRIRTGRRRATWEDRRMTTHPMELTFLSSGHGDFAQRRALGKTDPSRGALRSEDAAKLGGALGTRRDDLGDSYEARRDVGDDREGTTSSSPGSGLHDGRAGEDHRTSANGMFARPELVQGPPNVAATVVDRPRDNVDSDQDVALALRSIVHGSYAGGVDGEGHGGTAGGGAPGAGAARGEGSHPDPLGVSDGEIYDLETTDPRLLPYFRHMKSKIDPLWQNAFPRAAILDLKQGTVILDFTVARDGSVRVEWPPERPSGIDEFDRNCAAAIRRAAPFGPIPAALGVTSLRVRAPFVANNFVVK
ncbi:MAG TPA: TonB family protein [Polyangiaceae bacterium]